VRARHGANPVGAHGLLGRARSSVCSNHSRAICTHLAFVQSF
jgi:hypothetical protein